MFTASNFHKSQELVSERLKPKFQYDQLSSWVLSYQKEVSSLVDKVCREGVQSAGGRFNATLKMEEMQVVPYLATEYLDLISDPEGAFLSRRIDKITNWFQSHGVEHDEMGFRNLKAVVDTSLTTLRCAKDSFRSTRAPAPSQGGLWNRLISRSDSPNYNKLAYQQQLLNCLHKNIELIILNEGSSDSDCEAGYETVAISKKKSNFRPHLNQGSSGTVCSSSTEFSENSKEMAVPFLLQTEFSKLHPVSQYKTLKTSVRSLEEEVQEIVKEVCQKEIEECEGDIHDLPFIAVEYLDLVLEPKAECLLEQIERIHSWFEDNSIKHKLRFAKLASVVDINLGLSKSTKNKFRAMRAPKKVESTWNSILQKFSTSETVSYEMQVYRNLVMQALKYDRMGLLEKKEESERALRQEASPFANRECPAVDWSKVSVLFPRGVSLDGANQNAPLERESHPAELEADGSESRGQLGNENSSRCWF